MDGYQQFLDQSLQGYVIGVLIFMLVIWLGATVGLSFIPASMAKRKGYSFAAFYCLSFFVWFLGAIIIAALITDKNPKPKPIYMPYGQPYMPYGPYPMPYGQPVAPPPYGAPPQPQNQTGPAVNPVYYPPRCPNCGQSLTDQNDYCGRCGTRVK